MSAPGVVLVSKYVSGKSTKFSKYVSYIDRDEAVRTKKFHTYNVNKLDGYNQYMGNPEKSSGIFTKNNDNLSLSNKKKLQQVFRQAQKNDSVMWQDVISFDNKWLEEHGIYNLKTGWVNEGAIQNSIRKGMDVLLREERLEQSGVWSAAIHYNTDNIHVHIALVEPNPTKEYGVFTNKQTGETYQARRGNRKKRTLDKMKSTVANTLLDRDKELAKISQLIHEKIAPKGVRFQPNLDFKMLKMYNRIYQNLPGDMRLWKYNNNALKDVRPEMNKVITLYIQKHHPEEFKKLDQSLKEEMEFRKSVYGDGPKEVERYKEYRENKKNELYAKLGNAMLREMAEIRKQQNKEKRKNTGSDQPNSKSDYYGKKTLKPRMKKSDLNKIKRAFDADYERMKNKQKYQQLQYDIENRR
ncbi:MobP2 family relaxase [Bacillus swezeyi]|uniref:MobP2 family relaxase n=1 Tax=Bacillus swezeyi TaxID=1925020 RepID=UPI002E21F0AF|nr:MobP2 family relaxase [Bacillus swezeyi]